MAIIVSTKIDLLLTAEIDRIRNYNVFEKRKCLLQTITNQDKYIEIRQNAGVPTTIEVTPGLALVNGTIINVESLETVDLLGSPDGNYRVKIRVDNASSPATATLLAELITSPLADDDLTEIESGTSDLVLATLTLTSSNISNFQVVAETAQTLSQISDKLTGTETDITNLNGRVTSLENLHNDTGWIDLTYAAGYQPQIPGSTAQYKIVDDILYVRGTVATSDGTPYPLGVDTFPVSGIDLTGYVATALFVYDSTTYLVSNADRLPFKAYIRPDGVISVRAANISNTAQAGIYSTLNMVVPLDREV